MVKKTKISISIICICTIFKVSYLYAQCLGCSEISVTTVSNSPVLIDGVISGESGIVVAVGMPTIALPDNPTNEQVLIISATNTMSEIVSNHNLIIDQSNIVPSGTYVFTDLTSNSNLMLYYSNSEASWLIGDCIFDVCNCSLNLATNTITDSANIIDHNIDQESQIIQLVENPTISMPIAPEHGQIVVLQTEQSSSQIIFHTDFVHERFNFPASTYNFESLFDAENTLTMVYDSFTGKWTVNSANCNIITNTCPSAGDMGSALKTVCSGEIVSAPAENVVAGAGNVHGYLLHDGTGITIYDFSSSGSFTNNGIYPTNMELFVSSAVGPPDSNGAPDLSALCSDIILPGCPVLFYDPITIEHDFSCNPTNNTYDVIFLVTGGSPSSSGGTYNVVGSYNGSVSPDQEYDIANLSVGSSYSINVINDGKGCTGEIFEDPILCDNTTNVWPGDKNNDGIVDHKDVAIAGFLYETGPPRTPEHQNTDWYGHPCEDWNDNLPFNGANIKHLDCNGDGTISTTDADAVIENLGETHDEGNNQIFAPFFEETDYQIYLQPVDVLDNDNLLEVNVVLESKNGNNLNLQGGYFTINYNNVNTNISNAAMNFTNSWLGSPGINMIESYSNFPNTNQIEIGFSKTNGTNSNGKGIIGQLTFVLDNNAMRTANGLLDLEVIEIGVHDSQGNIQPIEKQLLQVGLNESNCETNWTITEESPFYNVYKSNGTIATDGFVLVGKEQQVQYSANRVSLEEGFSVRAGANFKVRYGSCN